MSHIRMCYVAPVKVKDGTRTLTLIEVSRSGSSNSCCKVLQCGAVGVQCGAVCCSALQCVVAEVRRSGNANTCCSVRCSVAQCVAECCIGNQAKSAQQCYLCQSVNELCHIY